MSLLLFSGCTTSVVKDLRSYLGYDEETLLSLKKGVISFDGETKATIQAIYLNNIDDKYENSENFFVAVYIADDYDSSKKYGLRNPNYSLKLNGSGIVKIVELDESSMLRKKMPLKSRWSHYYHVVFKQEIHNDLMLSYSHKDLAKTLLTYQKEPQQK